MSQFYLMNDFSVERCHESRKSGMVITITGVTEDGSTRHFTGVVESVDEDEKRQRWRITMRET
jgi:hypothetical protein